MIKQSERGKKGGGRCAWSVITDGSPDKWGAQLCAKHRWTNVLIRPGRAGPSC
jgi:hypothetical protein